MVHIPYINNSEAFVTKIKTTIDKHKKDLFLSVLIFSENGTYYEEIEKILRKAGIRNVFYLKNGLAGYKKYLQEQALIWQSKGNLKKTVNKCNSCS